VQREPERHDPVRHDEEPEAAVPAAPKLLRRAEVLSVAPAMASDLPISRGTLRGVVKWFDPRTGKGALRVPGYAGDLALDSKVMAEAGITRLYKGQEIEASIAGGPEAPRLVQLALPGGVAPVLPSGGMVRGRRAKPVVVEMKREALRRVAARAEAEQLLGPSRPR
jgi:cold shock CspA family protein